jgi:hypothetical protein
MGLVDEYCETVYKQTSMRAAYPPNRPVALGDYGTLDDGVFSRRGNVADFGIAIEAQAGEAPMSREFRSRQVSKAIFDAGAKLQSGVVVAAPALELGFEAEFSVYAAVAGCTLHEVKNVQALGRGLLEAAKRGDWDTDWVVVTSLIASSNTTVIVARGRGTRMVLSAKAEVAQIDLADANLALRVTFDSSSSEAWVTEKVTREGAKLTPFFWLHRIKANLFGGNKRFETLQGAAPRGLGAPGGAASGGATAGGEADAAAGGGLVSVGRPFDPYEGWRS